MNRFIALALATLSIPVGAQLLTHRVLADGHRTASQSQEQSSSGLIVKSSPYSVEETSERFVQVLEKKGLNIFANLDHSANAAGAGLELAETRVVMFGNPKLGTPLMQCNSSIGIDLPQKVLIWESEAGTQLAYNDPNYLVERHQLGTCGEEAIAKITKALDGLTNAAILPQANAPQVKPPQVKPPQAEPSSEPASL